MHQWAGKLKYWWTAVNVSRAQHVPDMLAGLADSFEATSQKPRYPSAHGNTFQRLTC